MAHAIDFSNARANMAYVGETPWHGLGSKLTEDATIDVWCKQAGLAWEIKRASIQFSDFDHQAHNYPARTVLYRGDTRAPLSIVSDEYKIVQPREVLEFFRELVEAGDMKLHTAGSLFGGERIWALAKLEEDFRLMGQDQIGGYLLLATSCDGSLATTGQFTTVRVVCNNTLQMSIHGDSQGRVKVPHSRKFNAESVKAQLGLGKVAFAEFAEVAERLAARKVTRSEAVQWLIDTFGDSEKAVDEQEKGAAQLMKKVWDACRRSPGATLKSADGTAWGLVNGASYYFDHARNTRTNDSRFDRAQFGDGAAAKRHALENALKLAA